MLAFQELCWGRRVPGHLQNLPLLGGSWVVISGVISKVTLPLLGEL